MRLGYTVLAAAIVGQTDAWWWSHKKTPAPTTTVATPVPTTSPVPQAIAADSEQASVHTVDVESIAWSSCSFATTSADTRLGECANVHVPLCYAGVCESDQFISVYVKRLNANEVSDTRQALWILPGQLGASSTSVESLLVKAFDLFQGSRSVYTLDRRGTGSSSFLSCESDISNTDNLVEYYTQCFNGINSKFGNGVAAAFSTTSAAHDVASLVQSSLFESTQVYLYGSNDGSYLAERVMHFAPSRVKGYILDNPQLEEFAGSSAPYYSNKDRLAGEVVAQVLALCDSDAFCASKIGPSAKETIQRVYTSLDSGESPCAALLSSFGDSTGVLYPSQVVSGKLSTWFSSSMDRLFIPAYIYRLRRCSDDDQAWIQRVHSTNSPQTSGDSELVHALVEFSELWETPPPSAAQLAQWSVDAVIAAANEVTTVKSSIEYCIFTGIRTSDCSDLPPLDHASSFVYPRDVYWNHPAAIPPQSSVLLLTGAPEGTALLQNVRRQRDAMAGQSKLLVEFPITATYSILDNSPIVHGVESLDVDCGAMILKSFLDSHGDFGQIQTTCKDLFNRPIAFDQWSTAQSISYFGSDDPYDGAVDNLAGDRSSDAPLPDLQTAEMSSEIEATTPTPDSPPVEPSANPDESNTNSPELVTTEAPSLATLPPVNVPDVAINWYPCSFTTTSSGDTPTADSELHAECADVAVPICHPGICQSTDKYTTVFIKRLKAKTWTPGTPILWFLQGGPGLASVGLEANMAQVYQHAQSDIDVYTMDHRGTGRSPLVDCPDDKNLTALASCLQTIKDAYGDDAPAAYSVTSAAADLRLILSSSLFANSEVFVYGVSYGTYLVERLMHLAPPVVKGYLLDSVQSEGFHGSSYPYLSNRARAVRGVVKQFFAACDADNFCNDKIGPSSEDLLRQVFQDLDAGLTDCAKVLQPISQSNGLARNSEIVGQTLYSWLQDRELRLYVPGALFRLSRCNPDDVEWTRTWKLANDPIAIEFERGPYLDGSGISFVVYYTTVFSELWQIPSPTVDELAQWAKEAYLNQGYELQAKALVERFCLFTNNADAVACQGFPSYNVKFTNPRDVYWNSTATIPEGASAILFSGAFDVHTPEQFAQDEFDNLVGDNKLLLKFPWSTHTILGNTIVDVNDDDIEGLVDCGTSIVVSYVQHRGLLSSTLTDCVAKVEKLDFAAYDVDVAADLLGSEDPYFTSDDQAAFVALIEPERLRWVEAMVALALICVVVVVRRRYTLRNTYIPIPHVVDSYGTTAV
ncbi:unnamed protein product [Aphanomyces euteiches]|uniref:Uncharacterized protein n=1 Tax=Aphanomyces euteiches TaxID=100861 RepID=A0A6G0XUJ7_9STRA|nr:hypothetical protein Ae201684_001265 [Aphanomyces euteiches]KAH9099544.1 hypothetical protein Ae201684P_018557 [Aphanomyces euteiches]KAH9155754.1 hypothetical protein AeRB84_002283 [Aphanomyces euteiches]